MGDLIQNYQTILKAIEGFKQDYQRPDSQIIRLMAVTKTRSADEIRPLLEAGHRLFGENRVQEAYEKFPELIKQYPDIELHLIGPLQSNKLSQAIDLFHTIETIDRSKLISGLVKERTLGKKIPEVFVQVNIGEEPQKSGVALNEVDGLIALIKQENLPLKGLMCVPPDGVAASPYFALLNKIARQHGLNCLSMGMSHDYQHAIALGSNIIRIGSALFGARNPTA